MRIDGKMELAEGRNRSTSKQQQQQQQWAPGNILRQQQGDHHNGPLNGGANYNAKAQDKNLQELRAFALEYVKQIVAKASELSQERQEARQAQKVAQFYTGGASYAANRQVREAASQINTRFQLIPATTEAADATCQAKRNNFHPMSASQRQQQQQHPEAATIERLQAPAPISGNDTSGLGAAEEEKEPAEGDSGTKRKRRQKRGLHQRLNWHLLVSCFSTCLPQTLVDTFPSGAHSGKVDPAAL